MEWLGRSGAVSHGRGGYHWHQGDGARHVARTRLMGVARIVLLIGIVTVSYVIFCTRAGG